MDADDRMKGIRVVLRPYVNLMSDLIEGRITARQFQVQYITKFKNEIVRIGGEEYDILQRLFEETDEYTEDPVLRREAGGLDEEELRTWVEKSRSRILKLSGNSD